MTNFFTNPLLYLGCSASARRYLQELKDIYAFELLDADDLRSGLRTLASSRVSLVLLDAADSLDKTVTAIERLRMNHPHLPIIVLAATNNDPELLAQSFVAGANFVMPKGIAKGLFADVLKEVMRNEPNLKGTVAHEEVKDELQKKGSFEQHLDLLIKRVAKFNLPVLITGENGVGKEVAARKIHQQSDRSRKKWVVVNCAAIPAELAESILFGHTRGAFTGANSAQGGLFKKADGSTIFLDEIGELPLFLQPKLLRVLQEGTFTPVGSSTQVRVDVRVIAATNRQLHQEVDAGKFRLDLFQRLNKLPVHIKPLRERLDELPKLVRKLNRKAAKQANAPVQTFTKSAMTALSKYQWPGNIRELETILERGYVFFDRPLSGKDIEMLIRMSYPEGINI